MKIKTVLIDDERNSRESLKKKIQAHCPELDIAGEAGDGISGLELIRNVQPALVFLDIEMPGLNGLALLQQVPDRSFDVIFTTAYNQYAINAIRCSALDYLVKPVDVEELKKAVAGAVAKQSAPADLNRQLQMLLTSLQTATPAPEKIAVAVSSGLEIITIADILYLEAQGNYTRLFFANDKSLLASRTLRDFEELLPADYFFRIHNAILVNVRYIKKYNKGDGGQVVLSNGAILDVARRRKDELLQLLSAYAAKL